MLNGVRPSRTPLFIRQVRPPSSPPHPTSRTRPLGIPIVALRPASTRVVGSLPLPDQLDHGVERRAQLEAAELDDLLHCAAPRAGEYWQCQ